MINDKKLRKWLLAKQETCDYYNLKEEYKILIEIFLSCSLSFSQVVRLKKKRLYFKYLKAEEKQDRS
mgnify:CR=1 FL=1